jgi:autotransporter-associated beta strand protein
VRNGGAIIDTNGNNVTIAQALEHSNIGGDNAIDGGLTKTGAGTLTLSGVNTYTGATVVAAGVLAVNGSINGGAVTVQAGATLQGTGSITTTGLSIAANATLAPGNSIGTLNVTGDLSLAGDYDWEFDGAASSADLVDVNGLLTLSGATLSAIDFNPVSYTLGQKFTLAAYDSLSGTFTGLSDDLVYTLGGNLWQINYDDTTAGLNGGSGSAFITLTAVPEPSTAMLGFAGILVLFRRRRA